MQISGNIFYFFLGATKIAYFSQKNQGLHLPAVEVPLHWTSAVAMDL
jgi:hypothetical protein